MYISEKYKKKMSLKKYGQIVGYDFVAPHEWYTKEELILFLLRNCKTFNFQVEEGKQIKENEETGYIHYQGRFILKDKIIKNTLIKLWNHELPKCGWIEPTKLSTFNKENFDYVTKEETRLYGPYSDENYLHHPDLDMKILNKPKFLPYHMLNINYDNLYPYQKSIIESGKLENRNPRVIDVIYDNIGNRGKSTIADYIDIYKLGYAMPIITDYNLLVASTCNMFIDNPKQKGIHDPKLLLFDMPRCLKKENINGLIAAFEQIKNGQLYDARHCLKRWRIERPRIWLFTNSIIDKSMLSSDRWNIWIINDDNELRPYNDNNTDFV